jgi:S-adenosylmethionine decarboxylase
MYDILGSHALTTISSAPFDNLNDKEKLTDILYAAVGTYQLTNIGDPIIHQFEPYGLTGFVLLSESHISIHTWPELGKATLDVFTCGNKPSGEIADYIAHLLSNDGDWKTGVFYR